MRKQGSMGHSGTHHALREVWVCLAIFALATAAFGEPDDTVARIGDKRLSLEQFEARARELRKTGYRHINELNRQNKRELLDGIIARELLVMEGIQRGLDRDSTIATGLEKIRRRALVRKLYEQEAVQESYVFTEEELRAFFVERQYDAEVNSQHIVCESDEKGRQVIAALQGGAPFESLVSTYSLRSIQDRFGPGGFVGWFKVGELPEELKVPLSTMTPGDYYPEPVKTPVGYHVFRLKARRPVDFAEVHEWIEAQARIQSRADDMERYVGVLRSRYDLVFDPEVFAALQKLPLETTKWSGEDRPIFTWRGGQLTPQDYMDQVGKKNARHPAALDSTRLRKEADNLAGRQIMMAEVRKLGIDDDADILSSVDKERAKLLVKVLFQVETRKRARTISDEAIRAFYDQNIDQFTREDGKVTDFSFLKESIRTALQERGKNEAMDAFLAELRQNYKDQIEIFPEVLDLAFAADADR